MNLGNKILELRKKKGFSQEQLAEKLNVTRQTISNWELEQTAPDINQAKEIAKIFTISLDELKDNDVKDVLVERISNTEKLAGMIIKILKAFGVIITVTCIVSIIVVISLFILENKNQQKEQLLPYINQEADEWNAFIESLKSQELFCTLDDVEYRYIIYYDENYNIWNPCVVVTGGTIDNVENIPFVDFKQYRDSRKLIEDIKSYFEDNGGTYRTNSLL